VAYWDEKVDELRDRRYPAERNDERLERWRACGGSLYWGPLEYRAFHEEWKKKKAEEQSRTPVQTHPSLPSGSDGSSAG